MDKKPFGSRSASSGHAAQGKPFKKFDKKPFGKAQGKPFGFKSAYKKSFGPAQRPPSTGPKMRVANKIGEYAPRPSAEFAAKPGYQMNTKKDFNAKWAKPTLAGKPFGSAQGKPVEKKLETGWGGVANWYHDTVEEKGSYQRDLILPNLLRLMDITKGETILDLACGEGFFSRRFARLGAKVIASDISKELIEIAKKDKDAQGVQFEVSPADKIPFVADGSVDKAVVVLALQNIENVPGVFAEVARVLKPTGKLFFVLNHPAFRIPKQSSWGWDQNTYHESRSTNQGGMVQYRRVDRYLSETREKIDMHPSARSGQAPSAQETVSFHRPLQYFVKSLKKNGFAITGMEEWISDRKSQPGPRAEAENRARVEIPMFMVVEAKKI